jgi:hypothetical protein
LNVASYPLNVHQQVVPKSVVVSSESLPLVSEFCQQALKEVNSAKKESVSERKVSFFLNKIEEDFSSDALGPEELKERLVSILHLYRKSFDISGCVESWNLLEDDIKTKTFYELRSKYSHLPSDDPLNHLTGLGKALVYLLGTKVVDKFLQKERACLPYSIARDQTSWAAIKRDEMLRLLIENSPEFQSSGGDATSCFVVDYRELAGCIDLLKMQDFSLESKQIQFLVRNDVHYTALSLVLDHDNIFACILDASMDPKCYGIERLLNELNIDTVLIGGVRDAIDTESGHFEDKIQYDFRSCSVFSLDHAKLVASDGLVADIRQKTSSASNCTFRLSWLDLPFRYIRLAQSPALLQHYISCWPDDSTAKDYIYACLDKNQSDSVMQNNGVELTLDSYSDDLGKIVRQVPLAILQEQACTHPYEMLSK